MKTNNFLIISGIIFTLILILWPLLMAISQPSGTLIEQLRWVAENTNHMKWQFFLAFLISPALIYLMAAQLTIANIADNVLLRLGMVFLAVYVALNCISYGSQLVLVPKLLEAGMYDQLGLWYFGSEVSIAYFLNQMGYFFWAIGTLVLFSRFVPQKGVIRYISLLYVVSAFLSIVAFVGLILDNATLNSMTFPSGLLLLPVGVITVVWGVKRRRNKSTLIEN
ncbi:MAG: hypothetical protein IH597_02785 [Bacteroidales bacterium]|nr:hypothetical protein [Bacteroidales bacterium]